MLYILIGQPAVDLGGIRRQFFTSIVEDLKCSTKLALFEPTVTGHLLLRVNQEAYLCRNFAMLGRIIIHSILSEGPGLPVFPKAIYTYLITSNVDAAYQYLDPQCVPIEVDATLKQVCIFVVRPQHNTSI
jgi:hypothetical protein